MKFDAGTYWSSCPGRDSPACAILAAMRDASRLRNSSAAGTGATFCRHHASIDSHTHCLQLAGWAVSSRDGRHKAHVTQISRALAHVHDSA
jgi:hypothetical protein